VGRLDGKVAIVTGAGGGIGREHALLLAREGAQVLVNDTGLRSGADAASVVKEIEAGGGTATANTTSATWDTAADIAAAALDAYGRVDILVNNATAGGINDLRKFTE
jgi:3-oxoacyl-[acyl-carrier protein] reductase